MERSLEQVGRLVRERRDALPLTVREAAALADVSDTTWGNVEAGRPSNPRTRLGVCRALRWTDDSFDRLLAGDEPIEVGGPTGAAEQTLLAAVLDLTEAVRELRADLRQGRR